MSKVAFSSITALMGSAVRSRLPYATQNVIALRLSTPNALNTKALSSKAHNTLNTKALSSKALNSNSRITTGLPQKICRTVGLLAIQPSNMARPRVVRRLV